ncbi:MAG: hypothetical protein AAGC67_11310, partial [Myxococcota bacterium]
MAGAPDDENEPITRGESRVRRFASGGLGALGLAAGTTLLLTIGAVVWGLSWLADRASHPEAPPAFVAAPRPIAVASLAEADALPPSVRRYLENTVYPPSVGRLTEAQGDLVQPNRRFEEYRPIPETFSQNADDIVTVRLTCDHYYYEGDDPIELSLEVLRGNRPVELLALDAGATREGRAGLEGNRSGLRFTPAEDGWSATLDPARFADHHGPILVDARIQYAPDAWHEETLRLFLTPAGRIPARFTGEVEDRLANGHLRVDVGIEVDQPGQYRIDANLYDRNDRPVAFSAFKGSLSGSDRTVSIEFFGRLLRDLGARGPYRVGEIRGYRFMDGEYPDRERMASLDGRFPTNDYALEAFSADEFMDAHKARMVELLMEDVARGIAVDAPPLARPGAAATGAAATPAAATAPAAGAAP